MPKEEGDDAGEWLSLLIQWAHWYPVLRGVAIMISLIINIIIMSINDDNNDNNTYYYC